MTDPALFVGRVAKGETRSDHESTSAGKPCNSLRALLEVIICSGFPTQVSLALVLNGLGLSGTTSQDGSLSFSYVTILSIADTMLIVGLIWYFLSVNGESIWQLIIGGLPIKQEALLGLVLIPLLVLGAAGGLLLLRVIAPGLHNIAENPLASMLDTPARALVFGLVAIIAGGVREEMQRAFILHRFEHHLGGPWLGLIVFSAIFGLGHYVQGFDAAIITGILGIVWGLLYLKRRSAIVAIVSHSGFNSVEIIIAVVAAQSL